MAERGRKPKPTAIKELEGNPGKRPLNGREPKPDRKAPACPKWLMPEAKKEWRRLAKKLEAMGVLTEVDMAAFATYCECYARWKEAEEFMTEKGMMVGVTKNGYWQQLPHVSVAQNYMRQMMSAAEKMGLTPSARSRLIADAGGANGERDELEELLGGDG